MTLATTTNVKRYTASGAQTVFAYDFLILAEGHLDVYVGTALQGSGYTVSGVGAAGGGNVTFTTAPAADSVITLIRDVPYTQPTDIPSAGALDTDALEDQLDWLTMLAQQLKEQQGRSLVLPITSSVTDLTLPTPEAGQFLAWNTDEDGLTNATPSEAPVSSAMQPVVAASTLASARDLLGVEIGADVQAYDADLAALAALDATVGVLAKTGAATYARRTITGTANHISVANGDGSGDPTISLPSTITVTGQLNLDNLRLDGNTLSSTSGDLTIAPVAGSHAIVTVSESGERIVEFINSNATGPLGFTLNFTAASPDDNSAYFARFEDSTAIRMVVYSDGDLQNHDNSYGAISDQRLKQDIHDAASQWDDTKALRVRKYKFISDVNAYGVQAVEHIGLVAQEVLDVSPGLVTGTEATTYGIQYSVLNLKLLKAFQEAQARIEALETKVTTLETQVADLLTRVTALEGP